MLVKLIKPMVTTRMLGLFTTTSGQKNSFQFHMNLMMSSVAMAGFTDGRTTLKKIPAAAGRLILFTTHGASAFHDFAFAPSDILLFGRESAGVPDEVHAAADARLLIPLAPGARSLNVV